MPFIKFLLLAFSIFSFSNVFADSIDDLYRDCSRGDGDSCMNLIFLYKVTGIQSGEPKLIAKSMQLEENVCYSLDIGDACSVLAMDYIVGKTTRKSYPKAKKAAERGCLRLSHGGCCRLLGDIYAKGLGATRSAVKAKEYYGQACDLGVTDACDEYSKLLRGTKKK